MVKESLALQNPAEGPGDAACHRGNSCGGSRQPDRALQRFTLFRHRTPGKSATLRLRRRPGTMLCHSGRTPDPDPARRIRTSRRQRRLLLGRHAAPARSTSLHQGALSLPDSAPDHRRRLSVRILRNTQSPSVYRFEEARNACFRNGTPPGSSDDRTPILAESEPLHPRHCLRCGPDKQDTLVTPPMHPSRSN